MILCVDLCWYALGPCNCIANHSSVPHLTSVDKIHETTANTINKKECTTCEFICLMASFMLPSLKLDLIWK